jgi:hypothetical protein
MDTATIGWLHLECFIEIDKLIMDHGMAQVAGAEGGVSRL